MSDIDGIVKICLDGGDFDLKPSWRAIAAIEADLGAVFWSCTGA